MSRFDSVRRATAPILARLAASLIRRPGLSDTRREALWRRLEYYVNFYNVTETRRCRTGAWMEVSTAKMVEKQIYYFGEWEPYYSRYLADGAPWDGIFLDVGANIGYYSLLAASRFDRVIAIEASPSIHARLAANIARNPDLTVESHNIAVGQEAGHLDFYYDPSQSGGSSAIPGGGREFEARVPVKPLFEIVPEDAIGQISMIKLDVEGFEHIVLADILANLPRLRPDLRIMVEYGPDRGGGLDDLFHRFLQAGFTARLIQGPYELDEYLDGAGRSDMVPLDAPPTEFCDVLLERQSAP